MENNICKAANIFKTLLIEDAALEELYLNRFTL